MYILRRFCYFVFQTKLSIKIFVEDNAHSSLTNFQNSRFPFISFRSLRLLILFCCLVSYHVFVFILWKEFQATCIASKLHVLTPSYMYCLQATCIDSNYMYWLQATCIDYRLHVLTPSYMYCLQATCIDSKLYVLPPSYMYWLQATCIDYVLTFHFTNNLWRFYISELINV
jgi:hypothetical protein